MRDPGVYGGVPDVEYHADDALSSSGVRKLLGPASCPALFDHWRKTPEETSDAFDRGHGAHTLILGTGNPFACNPFHDLRTKAAKAWVAEQRANGITPLKRADYDAVMGMADKLHQHPQAMALLNDEIGDPEMSAWWTDDMGVDCRARYDWLHDRDIADGMVVDYKTTSGIDPDSVAKAVANYGYAVQQAWYQRGLRALGYGNRPFLFIFQMVKPPYLVELYQLPADWVRWADKQCADAIDTFKACTRSGVWPGFTDEGPKTLVMPRWTENQMTEDMN